MVDLKNQIEAILFSVGKKVEVSLLKTLCDAGSEEEIIQQLKILREELKTDDSPLMLVEESNGWKLTLREKYLDIVQDIIPETELSKTVLETLAVIAWQQPVLQSEVIKIRTNKAYDHISELLDSGFITKEKQGRSYLIKATPKFFEYFDVPDKEKIKELFAKIEKKSERKDKEIEAQRPKKHLDGLDVYKSEAKDEEKTEKADDPDKKPDFAPHPKGEEAEVEEQSEEVETEVEEEKIDKTTEFPDDEDTEDEAGRKIDPELEEIYEEAKKKDNDRVSLEPDNIEG